MSKGSKERKCCRNYDPINIPQTSKWISPTETNQSYPKRIWISTLDASFNYSLLCLFIILSGCWRGNNFFCRLFSSFQKNFVHILKHEIKRLDTFPVRQLICIFSPSEIEMIVRREKNSMKIKNSFMAFQWMQFCGMPTKLVR